MKEKESRKHKYIRFCLNTGTAQSVMHALSRSSESYSSEKDLTKGSAKAVILFCFPMLWQWHFSGN